MDVPAQIAKFKAPYLPLDVEGVEPLIELALDLRWAWYHYTDNLWKELDPELWEQTRNPWIVLKTVSQEKLRKKLADPAFRKKMDELIQKKRKETKSLHGFRKIIPINLYPALLISAWNIC